MKINVNDYTGKNYLVDGCVVRALDNLYVSTDINELFGDSDVASYYAETYNGKSINLIYFYDAKTVRKIAKKSGMEHLLPDLGLEEETQVNLPDLVTIENGKATTTSLKVAEVFGKNHRDVLRDIRNLVEKGVRNFAQSSYINAQNKEQPMFLMDRDGFSLLVMGFTGDKALDWKLKYIEAFNKMEKALLDQRNNPALPQSYSEALRALADEAEARQALEAENKVLSPKAIFNDLQTDNGKRYLFNDAYKGFEVSSTDLRMTLLKRGVFRKDIFPNPSMKDGVQTRYVPREQFVEEGYFMWRTYKKGGVNRAAYYITPKGMWLICQLLMSEGLIEEAPAWLVEEVV